ncbi:mitochondrial ribosome-associated GTPase 2 [Sitophilus oryzae]|uniref:Mitochondrial ribosome-associated GTPase 2 n=1 Tax=Sitophilus oryzae TaxID=7048 RepID=A0A6J2X6G8_SITOR|nr:mitochondrial ribosome-associated GTPase 2 [Sitophilus oryzae]
MLNKFIKIISFAKELRYFSKRVALPVPSKKPKAQGISIHSFLDVKQLRTVGGKGGDGCISFLSLWSNEFAGPDGGDGGNGGHVIFQASNNVRDLNAIPSIAKGSDGEKGLNTDCHGKNASHCVLQVPVGTIIKNIKGKVIGDLHTNGLMFIAAKGGAGGKGNHFFMTDTEQAPKICEYGADGEDLEYIVEVRSMAHVGLIGFPNAGKSTILRAISRARPKVAPYPFTTLRPHLGIVEYDDYEQIAVADLPGLIPDSHKNKGLGIQFLKHTERCTVLLFVLDASLDEPWKYFEILQSELDQFNENFRQKPQIIVANKIDIPEAKKNLEIIQKLSSLPVIPISAKTGENIDALLREIKIIYDANKQEEDNNS